MGAGLKNAVGGAATVTAPSFLATKLEAFRARGDDDFEGSPDLEDIIALIDGRPALLREVEREPDELRQYIADELSLLLSRGLSGAVPGHLAGDAASQGRVPRVRCVLDRLRRRPQLIALGQVVQSTSAEETGVNGRLDRGSWRLAILSAHRKRASSARDHITLRVRMTNLSRAAGTVGNGRNVLIEDARGARFAPVPRHIVSEAKRLGLAGPHDPAVPDEPIETCWVYELPTESSELRLLLPFGGYELVLD